MKKIIALTLIAFLVLSPFGYTESIKETPRITDLSKNRKKKGADNLAAQARAANNVAQLKQVVLDLIELTAGGK